jgi:ribosomal protein S27AE
MAPWVRGKDGEMNATPELALCPHCGGMTVLAPDPRFRWVCGACGGPRVPGAPGKNAALAQARAALAAAFGWGAGAIALALTGALTAGLAALLFMVSQGLGIAIGVLAAVFLLFAWRSSARAGKRRAEAADAVKRGWREGARAILTARGRNTTAAQLAAIMQVDTETADELLTELAAHDEARMDIDDGSVKYRIDALAEKTAATREAEADADADAEADAEAAAKPEKHA